MTERLADIGAHIHAVRQVGAVVNAMRGLAGVRAQRGRALLPAVRAYAEVSARAIGQALALQGEAPARAPSPAGARPALIVFGRSRVSPAPSPTRCSTPPRPGWPGPMS